MDQFANTIESRKDPGEYWTSVMKDQPMPEAIHGLVQLDSSPSKLSKNANCHTSEGARKHKSEKPFDKDFEPRPSVTAYANDVGPETKNKFVKDFEPRPSITAYVNDVGPETKNKFVKDFEPRPSITAYSE